MVVSMTLGSSDECMSGCVCNASEWWLGVIVDVVGVG